MDDAATDSGVIAGGWTIDFVLALQMCSVDSLAILAGTPAVTSGPSSPYGTSVLVSNLTGRVSKVTATLRGLSHLFPDDLDILLVGPLEQKVMLMSDAGGSAPISDLTLTFDQNATWTLSDAGAIQFSRAYKPVDLDVGETMPSPAPAGPYSSVLTSFDRTNPNGAWRLYVADDAGGGPGHI